MMASSAYEVAKNLFHYAKGNAKRAQEIKKAFDSAMAGGALTRGGLDSITSGTKNGVTMKRLVQLAENDRLTALRIASQWIEAGFIPSQSRSLGRF
jgi:hypothetical protein